MLRSSAAAASCLRRKICLQFHLVPIPSKLLHYTGSQYATCRHLSTSNDAVNTSTKHEISRECSVFVSHPPRVRYTTRDRLARLSVIDRLREFGVIMKNHFNPKRGIMHVQFADASAARAALESLSTHPIIHSGEHFVVRPYTDPPLQRLHPNPELRRPIDTLLLYPYHGLKSEIDDVLQSFEGFLSSAKDYPSTGLIYAKFATIGYATAALEPLSVRLNSTTTAEHKINVVYSPMSQRTKDDMAPMKVPTDVSAWVMPPPVNPERSSWDMPPPVKLTRPSRVLPPPVKSKRPQLALPRLEEQAGWVMPPPAPTGVSTKK